MVSKINVAICGGSGYTGSELLRLLLGHPKITVTAVTSEQSAGKSPVDLFPHLPQYAHLRYEPLNKKALLKKADLFFMALPHSASQEAVDFFFKKGKKVLDLSADFRIKNPLVYEQWYKTAHNFPKTLEKAVYGLPEIYRKKIKAASLIAVPGCYPTSALLGLYPLLAADIIDTSTLVIDSKSGASGAGRKADISLAFTEVNEGFKAYGVASHRHTPEIEQEMTALVKRPVAINFTPHLLPISRGMLSTMYGRLRKRADMDLLIELFTKTYENEPFVRVLPSGTFPNVNAVRGTNRCDIGYTINERTSTIIVVSAIDNLVKGASGQAIQCMNLMMGYPETTALDGVAVCP